jgi:cystathionine beta-lyase
VKLLLLCNPHNPSGRVWTKDELRQLGEICQKYNVIVASDEIHGDLVFAPNVHTPFACAGENFDDFSVTFTAVTKTFNLAGLKCSMVFAKNPELREQFLCSMKRGKTNDINTFGMYATESAYRTGDNWLSQLLVLLDNHLDLVERELIAQTKINWFRPQATYLCWLDFSAYGISDDEIEERLIHTGKVVLNRGNEYGTLGTQFMRFNVASPTAMVEEGIRRIKRAFADLENE